MNNDKTTSAQMVFCHRCGVNLSKAISVMYIDGFPICTLCLEKLNKKT